MINKLYCIIIAVYILGERRERERRESEKKEREGEIKQL
jgi:hypothetical protein